MKRTNKYFSLFLVVTILISLCIPAHCADIFDWESKWDAVTGNGSVISVTPGQKSDELRFCWLSGIREKNEFLFGTTSELTEKDRVQITERITITAQKKCTVEINNLKANTTYYYTYAHNDQWSETYTINTQSDSAPFTVLAVSDAQLGRSGDWKEKSVLLHDVAGWDSTLQSAMDTHPEISLCLSAGDQAEIGAQETQYRLFLAPNILRSLPIATTIGNHEFYFPYLNLHFNNPNRFSQSIVHSLGDEPYYFEKNDVLFIVLDSNNLLTWDHEAVLNAAVKRFPDTRWRVVMMHHSLFSCEDSMDDAPVLRKTLSPLLQKYGIDLVVSGHTHRYSRSKPIMNGTISDKGTVYLECGCSSGCNGKACPEDMPLYTQAGYHSKEPVYSILQFTNENIQILTYAVVDGDTVLVDKGVATGIEHATSTINPAVKVFQQILSVFGRMVSVMFS